MSEVISAARQLKTEGSEKQLNPFPGLRPFSINESHLFFGREGQCEEIISTLGDKRFVAVTGASGSGKSSLIYCGLIPILYGGFITQAGSEWKVVSFRPGSNPVTNMAKAVTKVLYNEKSGVNETITETILYRSSQGLIEAIKQSDLKKGENVLLLVDQFEELFRYRKSENDLASFNESRAFVNLLVEAVRDQQLPLYIILTMRSDFIGDCAQFQELTKLINEGHYLIPQMTRDDFRKAITGPLAVCSVDIDSSVVDELLNDISPNPDQLPVLQHALMRTWEHWYTYSDKKRPIFLTDYVAIGKIDKALSEHANEAYNELTDEGRSICRSMFKSLVEKGTDNREVRRPTKVQEIAEIAWVPSEKVIEVVEHFRRPGRSFLTPSADIPLDKDSVIDLSHESLMRIWNKMRGWVEEEAASVRMYKRLAEAAANYQATKTGLLKPPELLVALEWEKNQQPVLAWAKRYNPAFERTKIFLRMSEREYEEEEQRKMQLHARKLKRIRMYAVLFGVAAILAILGVFYVQSLRVQAEKAKNVAEFEKKVAEEQRKIAQKKTQEAQEQKEIALKLKALADKQSEIAEQQKVEAIKNADSANFEYFAAYNKTLQSLEEKALAEKRAETAMVQKQQAEQEREESYKERMLSIAKSMAIKSLEIDQDPDLKALLAYQAYQFNLTFGGNQYDNDIYEGLYAALSQSNHYSPTILEGHTGAVNSITFIPYTNTFFTAGSDGLILRWNLDNNAAPPFQIIDNSSVNKVLAISNNAKWLACGTSGLGIELFDLKSVNLVPRYLKDSSSIFALTFLPDNKHLVSASDDGKVEVWDLDNSKGKQVFSGSLVLCLCSSPDGRLIAAGTKDGRLILFDSGTFSQEVLSNTPENSVYTVCFSHNGKFLATGYLQGDLKYWNLNKKSLIASVKKHTARITDIKFSPDDELLTTSSFDASVRLWLTSDLISSSVKLKDHSSWVLSLAFNPSGDKLVSGSFKDNYLVVNYAKSKLLADKVYEKLKRNMTENEWAAYVGKDIPYEPTLVK